MTSVHVISGFAPPPPRPLSKILATPMVLPLLKIKKHQTLLIAIFAASRENLKEIANQSDSIGTALN